MYFSTIKFLMGFFGRNAALGVPAVKRSPLARLLCYLAGLAYGQFMECSFRAKVWFILLCFFLVSWVIVENFVYLFVFFGWSDLEGVLAAMFPEEDSESTGRRFYSDLQIFGSIVGLMLFVYLSHLGTLMFRFTLFIGCSLYNSGPAFIAVGNVIETKVLYMLWVVFSGVGKVFYWILLYIYTRLSRDFTPIFSEPFSEKVAAYFFDSSSKEQKSLLVRFCNYAFDVVYERFMSCSFKVKAWILFVYFLVVLHLVVDNYQWILSPFWRESGFADEYTILFKIGDRDLYPIRHGVYSVSWLYFVGVGAVLCSNLSPERMLRHQYLLLLIPYFRSYFFAVSSNVFLLLAVMLIRACFFYKKRYLYFVSIPMVFVLLSLFLLDLTICLEDLGKDNFLRIV